MCTINALCLETLPEFLDYLLTFKTQYGRDFPSFTLNILRFPSFQSHHWYCQMKFAHCTKIDCKNGMDTNAETRHYYTNMKLIRLND
jgi:hypothetical protein